MLSFSPEQNEDFVIFGIAPKRLGEVTKLVQGLPHKYVIGTWKGALEVSCLMPLKNFHPIAKEIGKGEAFYLQLGRFNPKKGSRPAVIVPFWVGEPRSIGDFSKVSGPTLDEDFTFDPETGFFYEIS